jgi:hypothetical protein
MLDLRAWYVIQCRLVETHRLFGVTASDFGRYSIRHLGGTRTVLTEIFLVFLSPHRECWISNNILWNLPPNILLDMYQYFGKKNFFRFGFTCTSRGVTSQRTETLIPPVVTNSKPVRIVIRIRSRPPPSTSFPNLLFTNLPAVLL